MTDDKLVLVLPVKDWPEADRNAWQASLVRHHSPFRSRGGGRQMNAFTLRVRQTGWGRYLAYLLATNQLIESAAPEQRVSESRLDDYICHLRGCGNADQTILTRVVSLRMALLMMAPGSDLDWMLRPRGVPIRHYFPGTGRARSAPHSGDLLAWAEAVFEAGLKHHKPRCRRAMVRDAAMMGMLVMPAPRINALYQFELGRNLQRFVDGWCVDQNAGITKMSRAEWCPLHWRVGAMLDRYLAVERLELLGGRTSARLWIAQNGGDLTKAAILTRLSKLSHQQFGKPVGPHAFRRGLATTNALENFTAPLDASVLLGHTSPATTNRHYNLAKACAAAQRHADRLRRLRGQR